MSTIQNDQRTDGDLDYALVDVFAERPLEGNMLAIFTDARGLSDEHMQALARAMNLPETTFIFPGEDPAAEQTEGVRVRIFTTREELPFAGHPTLGTASWLFRNHPALRGAQTINLALNAGPIAVTFAPQSATEPGVIGSMRQFDPTFGRVHDRAQIAAALGLAPEDLHPDRPVETVSTGLPFCIVPLRSLEAIGRLRIPQAAAQAYLSASDAKFFFCVAPADPTSGTHFHNRMQFYDGEDPATGSASGCAIAYLVRHGIVRSGQPIIFEQGVEILRPSRIEVRATLVGGVAKWDTATQRWDGGQIKDVFVAGRTIPVATGRFFRPAPESFPQASFTKQQHSWGFR